MLLLLLFDANLVILWQISTSLMNIILFDDPLIREQLLPLSFTRPIANFRIGITTITEKWQSVIPGIYSFLTTPYLSEKYPAMVLDGEENLFIAGNVIPDYSKQFTAALMVLNHGDALMWGDTLVAFNGSQKDFSKRKFKKIHQWEGDDLIVIKRPYDIFLNNGTQIVRDFSRLDTSNSRPISASNTVIGDGAIYIAPGATVEGAIINVKNGPVYIGHSAEVMEGCCLRGPIAICDHAVTNMGTKVYPDTTIGPWSKVGGELNNAVIFGYSNKAHDGFLGNAVIGEWCNLGAGCVASNLKNDYTPVRVWNYHEHRFERTSLQFCGLIMGDHSKAGINTMFNTATVVGVGCNIHGSGFPRTFIPSFSEGGASGFNDVMLTKFFDIAERVMARRHCSLSPADRAIFEEIYNIADTYK